MERFKIFLLTVAVSAQVTSQDSTDELPQAQIQSNWTEAFTGEKVSLQCVIQSVSTSLNYLWFKGSDKIVSSGEISINGNTLTLSVDSSRNGTYECQAELQGRNVTTAKPYLLRVKELPHPKLSIESKWKVFYPTEKVTLKCSIDEDSNEWGYEWFRNGNQLHEDISSSGNTLSISSAKAIQSGQYTCRGKHLTRPTVTTNQTEAVQLRIQDDTPKPTITKHQWFEFFYTEERVQLHCNMPGDGWEYHWHKDSNPLTTNPELTINSTSVNDTGVYHCKAQRGDFSVDSETVQVRVQKPPEPQIQSNWTEAFPGENVSLQCVIQDVSKNWNYLWFKNSSEISSGEININGNTLTLSVESSHNGAYECQAELQDRNVTTAKSTSHSLTVHGSQPTILLEQDPPYPEIYTGEQVKLSCRIQEQTSQWEYLWKKDSQQVNTDVNNSIYTIQNATRSQKGEYTCHVQRREMTFAKSTNLTIRERPEPKIQSNWTEAFTGEKVSLQCVIQDVSENWNYLWFKNSSEISSGEININGNTLTLSVESSHNGAYECQAKLQDRKVTTTKSTMHLLRVKELPQPKLSIESKWKVFYPTEKVTLNCSIDEDSNEWDYEWFRNGAQLHEDEDISFAGNTLSISSARANHSGQYTCRGKYMKRTSVTTNQTEAVQLHIQGITPKPNITKHQWFEFFYTKERVQLHCNMPGVGWEYHWYKDSKLWITNPELTIDSASVPDTGDFHCEAKRGNFSMDSETVQVRVQKPPEPQIQSDWTEAFHGENVSLQCVIQDASKKWNYLWFTDSDKIVSSGERSIKGNTLTLTIESSHNGAYVCQAELQDRNVTTEKSAAHSLTVHERPQPKLSLESQWNIFYPTEKVTLKCSVDKDSNEWGYEWFKNKAPLHGDKDVSLSGNTLFISSAKASHSGQYTCGGKYMKRTSVTTNQTEAVHLQINDNTPKPNITKHVWFELLYTDEQVQLHCEMQGVGWEYHWYKGLNFRITNPTHTINSTTVADTGDYYCKAQRGDFSVDSETVQVRVEAHPPAFLNLETELSDIMTGEVTLRCNVSDGRQWNYTWYMNRQKLDESSDVLKVPGNEETIKSEFKCKGIRTERPLYSALSDGFTANNIIFKRKILLAISGCLVCCIVILIIGCIVLKITRKPGVKERATEDLFFSMKDSNNQIVSPMKEYMDDIPIELEECQETEELITDHASAIHEDGVIEDEETPASESNGLTSFKGVKDTAPEDLVLSVTDSKNQAVSPIKDIDNSPTELEECQEKEELITDCASAVHEDGVVIKGEETPASESNGLTSFKISLKGEETPASESNGLTSFKDEETPASESNGLTSFKDEETPTSESNGLTSFKDKEKPASEANGLTSFKEL
ncbi:basement membrane-specific heparan sulfate proteoglycan core protein isoform X17 [Labeo rohita]|uniref:basement membrane-specific heparan sulfate proteoglycan core protein isoform X17 n=1 Tax=Labeo rohita TaxID=84645 RepID=UPI0021E25CF2|nr:basement membrane-specific heparan sulfate proteoglycan core protein isoform X17 [Labeo rohita]